jgi:hypothetical protein
MYCKFAAAPLNYATEFGLILHAILNLLVANKEAVLILGKLGEILPYIYRQTNPQSHWIWRETEGVGKSCRRQKCISP